MAQNEKTILVRRFTASGFSGGALLRASAEAILSVHVLSALASRVRQVNTEQRQICGSSQALAGQIGHDSQA